MVLQNKIYGSPNEASEYRRIKASRLIVALFLSLAILTFGGSLFIGLENALDANRAPKTTEAAVPAIGTVALSDEDTSDQTVFENDGCTVIASDGAATDDTVNLSDDDKVHYILPLSSEQQDAVYKLCDKYDVPSDLAFGIISADAMTERTDENKHLIMDINPANAEWCSNQLGISVDETYDANLECGIMILSEYYHKYSSVSKIAMCYELGEKEASEMWADGVTETEYSRIAAREIITLTPRSE